MNPFYNKEQRRLRALWRILIQGGLFFIGLAIVGAIVGVVAVFFMAASGQADLQMLTDQQAITDMIMSLGSGWFFALNGVGTVIVIVLTFFLAGWLLDRRKFVDFGFHFSGRWWADLGFGMFLGAILMVFIFLMELAFGWVTIESFFQARSTSAFLSGILAALVGFIAVGIYEEMLFRGYHLRNLAEGLNWKSSESTQCFVDWVYSVIFHIRDCACHQSQCYPDFYAEYCAGRFVSGGGIRVNR